MLLSFLSSHCFKSKVYKKSETASLTGIKTLPFIFSKCDNPMITYEAYPRKLNENMDTWDLLIAQFVHVTQIRAIFDLKVGHHDQLNIGTHVRCLPNISCSYVLL